jgi:hypothetical protein
VQHPLTQPEVIHQFDDPMLQHTGANGFLDDVPVAGFDDDGADPSAMQQVRQEQSGGASADNSDLGFHMT